MIEAQARQVLLVRAVEISAAELRAELWTAADAAWAAREARRQLGEHASAEAFIARRAELALQRLAERDPRWRDAAQGVPAKPSVGVGAGLFLLALLLAALIVGDMLGPSRRLNLLAPPVLALCLWNLALYLALGFAAVRGWRGARVQKLAAQSSGIAARLLWLAMAITAWLARQGVDPGTAAVRTRFGADWARVTRDQQLERIAAWLHAAAALLALAVVLSMYLFGLVFDYRAGWDSTWLDAGGARRVLGLVYGPAAALSGIELPDAAALARLRWADGSAGESAARWIHLCALTLAGLVIVPRLLLAALAALRARRAAARVALPLDDAYFKALLRDAPAAARPVTVLPYSYQLAASHQAALASALVDVIGPGAQPRLAPTLPLGAEDDLKRHLPEAMAGAVAALFAASATPERETHAAFVRTLVAELPAATTLLVLVDESGLRRRLGPGAASATRLAERRTAWQRMLHDLSLPAPYFVDLDPGPSSAPAAEASAAKARR